MFEGDPHWYSRDGSPRFVKPNGKPVTLREARKEGLLPSVTTVIQILAQPGIDKWKWETIRNQIKCTPRKRSETVAAWYDRCTARARELCGTAAEDGDAIHRAINAHLVGAEPVAGLTPWVDAFRAFQTEFLAEVTASETVLIGHGYAGTRDLAGLDWSKGEVLVDIKTQEWDGKKPDVKPHWAIQLAAYLRCGPDMATTGQPECWNWIIHRSNPDKSYLHIWSESEIATAQDQWLKLFALWRAIKRYDPCLSITQQP